MDTNLDSEIKNFLPALFLARLIPRPAMKRLRFLFGLLFACFFGLTLLTQLNWLDLFPVNITVGIGLSLLFGAFWLEQICIYFYHNWYYFKGLDSTIGQEGKTKTPINYAVAEIFSKQPKDVVYSFINSTFGKICLQRLEINQAKAEKYLTEERTLLSSKNIQLDPNKTTTSFDVAKQLYELDASWQKFLTAFDINQEVFLETVSFVNDLQTQKKRSERWWSRDALSHFVSIGNELTFSDAPFVYRFSQPLLNNTIFSQATDVTTYTKYYANLVLNTLASHSISNVLLIGLVGVGKINIAYTLSYLLTHGEGLNSLRGHHVILVDTEHLLTPTHHNDDLEYQVVRFFEEALLAGNIILVIPSLHTFIATAEERGLIISELLEKYFNHCDLHIIALDTPEGEHQVLKNFKNITRRFETLIVEPANLADTITLLQVATKKLEEKTGKMITYPALLMTAESAKRYLTDGVLPDRAISLLEHVFEASTTKVINQKDVTVYLSQITGIELGPITITGEERDELLNIENLLNTYVIGQTKATKAVANTLRRIRIDTNHEDRPKGSFLFLGPTGVGKTSLAETLSRIYSKVDTALIRFDMSEFNQADSLSQLIGDQRKNGMLTKELQRHPFRVVLFDEFEKAHPSIHDLFLQILDEGYFTNTKGEKIDARNTIIIATSNASSKLISQITRTNGGSPILTEEILRHLIDTNIFTSELLNRFDEVIIFKPLSESSCRYILQKTLSSLVEKMKDDGYIVSIDDDVLEFLLVKGFSPEFGARALKHVVADMVESEITKQIIAENIQKGGVVHISRAMLTSNF